MPKISVIIPVYNVEKYLKECLDSVVKQSYKNLEIICINDCTTDNSQEILNEYAQKDKRIILLKNEKNLGLGLSRNEGLKIATGDYIHFLDSDDSLAFDCYKKFVDFIVENGVQDVVQCNWAYCDKNSKYIRFESLIDTDTKCINTNLKKEPSLAKLFPDCVWSKIFKKDFLSQNGIIFNDYRCMEDIEFSNKTLALANTISCIPMGIINYRQDIKNSLSNQKQKYWKCMYDSIINSYVYFAVYNSDTRILRFSDTLIYFYNFIWELFLNRIIDYKILFNIVKKINIEILQVDFITSSVYCIYNDVLEKSRFVAFFKYILRFKFPKLSKILISLKKKVLGDIW